MTVGARTKSHPMAVRLTLVLLRQHSVVFSWHNWLCSSAARRTRSWKREKKTCEEVRKRSSGHLTAPFDLEKGWIAAFLFVCRECLHLSRGEEICKCFWRHCFGWRSPTFGCLSTLMCTKINQLLTIWDEKNYLDQSFLMPPSMATALANVQSNPAIWRIEESWWHAQINLGSTKHNWNL